MYICKYRETKKQNTYIIVSLSLLKEMRRNLQGHITKIFLPSALKNFFGMAGSTEQDLKSSARHTTTN